MSGKLVHTLVVRHPETLEATALLAGTEVPDWATDLVDKGNLSTGSDADSGSGSGSDDPNAWSKSMKLDELQGVADTRKLTVEGTGTDGKVTKADLVAALEADDAK